MKRFVLLLAPLILLFGCAAPEKVEETTVFYPSPPQQPRLQFLVSINGEEDIGEPQSALKEFLVGDAASEKWIGKPYDIASSPGKIYVMDRRFNKLLIIDLAKRTFNFLNDNKLGALAEPSGIWVSEDEVKYIADMKRKQVVVFDRDNNYLRVYGQKNLFDKPVDVAVYNDRVYVCDMKKHKIFVLDKGSGSLVTTIGSLGVGDGKLYKPSHINVDQAGNIYINDAFNFKVHKFDKYGEFVRSYGFHGDIIGAFARPKGLDVDDEGHIYVVDSAFENVQIFDAKTAKLLLFFGGSGNGPGNMYLPAAVHIDYANAQYFSNYVDKDFKIEYVVYVGNMFGPSKLNVYGFGTWVGPSFLGGENETDEQKDGNQEAK